MNLITNAVEAVGKGEGRIAIATGSVTIDAGHTLETVLGDELPEGTYVYLEVSDTGCGMDADTRSRIFDPFFTTKFTGRGLGLAAVIGIVRRHEGCLAVDTAPGRGTRFSVFLPALPPETERDQPAAPPVPVRPARPRPCVRSIVLTSWCARPPARVRGEYFIIGN